MHILAMSFYKQYRRTLYDVLSNICRANNISMISYDKFYMCTSTVYYRLFVVHTVHLASTIPGVHGIIVNIYPYVVC